MMCVMYTECHLCSHICCVSYILSFIYAVCHIWWVSFMLSVISWVSYVLCVNVDCANNNTLCWVLSYWVSWQPPYTRNKTRPSLKPQNFPLLNVVSEFSLKIIRHRVNALTQVYVTVIKQSYKISLIVNFFIHFQEGKKKMVYAGKSSSILCLGLLPRSCLVNGDEIASLDWCGTGLEGNAWMRVEILLLWH